MTDKPLLRVRATRLRASASSDAAIKDVNLAERNSEAEPPIPMAFTVLKWCNRSRNRGGTLARY